VLLSSFFSVAFAQPSHTLLIAAASDLIDIQAPLARAYTDHNGVRLLFTFGPSGQLARQIANGAPYDVFLSADEDRVKDLDSVAIYAEGRIALWSKSGTIRKLDDLAALRHIAIANPAHAPYGIAAKQALEKSGLWNKLQAKIVYGESVRNALEYAESGNAEVAITAWSLVVHRGGILLPAVLHSPIRQAGGVVKTSKNKDAARAFLRFLLLPETQRLLENNGFSSSHR